MYLVLYCLGNNCTVSVLEAVSLLKKEIMLDYTVQYVLIVLLRQQLHGISVLEAMNNSRERENAEIYSTKHYVIIRTKSNFVDVQV